MVNNRNHHTLEGKVLPLPASQPVDEGWWESLLSEEERFAAPGNNLHMDKAGTHRSAGVMRAAYPSAEMLASRLPAASGCVANGGGLVSAAKPGTLDSVNWEHIQKLFDQDETLTLEVTGFNRGGLLVDGDMVHGFVPISHLVSVSSTYVPGDSNGASNAAVETEREEILSSFVGQRIDVKVIECDPARGRVVFSERAAQSSAGRRNQLLNELKPGECVRGVITNLTDFGVFIDLGGVEGLVHISEISWGRVRHPEDLLSVGEQITAYVIQIDRERARIALSLKRLCSNPWTTIDQRYQVGQIIDVTVTSLVPFGAFARLEDGLDGLIHISEMYGENEHFEPIVHEGQHVQARILHIDPARQRLGLSLNLEE